MWNQVEWSEFEAGKWFVLRSMHERDDYAAREANAGLKVIEVLENMIGLIWRT